MANPNWFDVLGSPQYEQGGRFNVLSIPQLIYGMTPAGRQEIMRQKMLRERGQEAAVAGSEAGVQHTQAQTGLALAGIPHTEAQTELTQAETGRTGATTRGLDIGNRASEFNLNQAIQRNQREEQSRNLFTQANAGLTPEDVALRATVGPQMRQEEVGPLGMTEINTLARRGVPITPQGQAAAQLEAGQGQHAAELASHERIAREQAAMHVLQTASQAEAYGAKGSLGVAAQVLKSLGYPVESFNQQTNPAAAIDSAVRGGTSGTVSPGVTPPNRAAARPAPTAMAPGTPGQVNPIDAMLEKYRGGAIGPNAGKATGKSQRNTSSSALQLEGLRSLEQYLSTSHGRAGDQNRLMDLDEVRRMIQQLQSQP